MTKITPEQDAALCAWMQDQTAFTRANLIGAAFRAGVPCDGVEREMVALLRRERIAGRIVREYLGREQVWCPVKR